MLCRLPAAGGMIIQDPVYEFPRIHLLGNPMNKGQLTPLSIKSLYLPALLTIESPFRFPASKLLAGCCLITCSPLYVGFPNPRTAASKLPCGSFSSQPSER
jgi:hypothetical protein